MRINPSAAPGHAASPKPEFEFGMDRAEARALMAMGERIRARVAETAAFIAAELSKHDAWSPEHLPRFALPAKTSADPRAERLRAILEEAVDEQMHQAKLEEAAEVDP